eukprot:CAMPEP_0197844832 /NCGR_PEP_ID=MMETSP1438-20131217/1810_1 /TAXON_ID=1461541 /ORGANISM="Pterosperma sp., Strain CCMP1384" /LENGTH=39 /DNA_ID= /DNA_START= /DNA_END= /DNA_ORIENTATION=
MRALAVQRVEGEGAASSSLVGGGLPMWLGPPGGVLEIDA